MGQGGDDGDNVCEVGGGCGLGLIFVHVYHSVVINVAFLADFYRKMNFRFGLFFFAVDFRPAQFAANCESMINISLKLYV